MTGFNKFPTKSAGDGGGGGSQVIGGGPYINLTGFKKGSDSSTFLDVKGYPVTDGSTVKAIQLSSYNNSAITSYIGVNSAGTTVWTSDTTSLSTTTGVAITQCTRPVWDGTNSDMVVICTTASRTVLYLVSVNLQTGAETSIGNVTPATTPNASMLSYNGGIIDYDGTNIYLTNNNNANVESLVIDAATPSIVHEFDHGDIATASGNDANGCFGKYSFGGNASNIYGINMETGALNRFSLPSGGMGLLAPVRKGQGWGGEYVADISDAAGASAGASVAGVARWPRSAVSGYFQTLAEIAGIAGGAL